MLIRYRHRSAILQGCNLDRVIIHKFCATTRQLLQNRSLFFISMLLPSHYLPFLCYCLVTLCHFYATAWSLFTISMLLPSHYLPFVFYCLVTFYHFYATA
jgi:hypothetical protein